MSDMLAQTLGLSQHSWKLIVSPYFFADNFIPDIYLEFLRSELISDLIFGITWIKFFQIEKPLHSPDLTTQNLNIQVLKNKSKIVYTNIGLF